jgi:membrane-associated phospholipid phosphatase
MTTFLNLINYIITQTIVATLYYTVIKVTTAEPLELPLTFIDTFFTPHYAAVWIYMSFFFLLMSGVTFTSRENSFHCMKVVLMNSLIASIIFIFFPTKITYWDYAPYITENTLSYDFMMLIKDNDQTYNCFPSLHISNSVVALYFLNKDKKIFWQILNISWMLAIIWSVISTKQHTFYDVIGGTVLAISSYVIIHFIDTKKNSKFQD